MTSRHSRRPAFLLVQLVTTLPLAALLLLVLGRVVLDAVHVQNVAAQHANMTVVGDAMLTQLRLDALAAASCRKSDAKLTLRLAGANGGSNVEYTFTPTAVWRAARGDVRVWQARRLRFDWSTTWGPAGGVLTLDLVEMPPPRKSAVLTHTYHATVVLPMPAEGPASTKEPKP